jgi:hypothetical protein
MMPIKRKVEFDILIDSFMITLTGIARSILLPNVVEEEPFFFGGDS